MSLSPPSRRHAFAVQLGHKALGFAILVALMLAGGQLAHWLHLPIPAAIVGMMLLLVVLAAFPRLLTPIEAASLPLLQHIMLFIIPSATGVMEQFQALRAGWLPFVASSIVGAALTLVVTALTFQALLKRQERKA